MALWITTKSDIYVGEKEDKKYFYKKGWNQDRCVRNKNKMESYEFCLDSEVKAKLLEIR